MNDIDLSELDNINKKEMYELFKEEYIDDENQNNMIIINIKDKDKEYQIKMTKEVVLDLIIKIINGKK